MALTKIEGNLVGLQISTNLVTPAYKDVVCAEDHSLDGSADINRRKTKTCGTLTSRSTPEFTMSGSGVANATPEASEVSADELMALFISGASFLVKLAHATDDELYYRQGTGVLTSYSESAPEGDLVAFDFEIAIDGDLDIVA